MPQTALPAPPQTPQEEPMTEPQPRETPPWNPQRELDPFNPD